MDGILDASRRQERAGRRKHILRTCEQGQHFRLRSTGYTVHLTRRDPATLALLHGVNGAREGRLKEGIGEEMMTKGREGAVQTPWDASADRRIHELPVECGQVLEVHPFHTAGPGGQEGDHVVH